MVRRVGAQLRLCGRMSRHGAAVFIGSLCCASASCAFEYTCGKREIAWHVATAPALGSAFESKFVEADFEIGFNLVDIAERESILEYQAVMERVWTDAEGVFAYIQRRLKVLDAADSCHFELLVGELRPGDRFGEGAQLVIAGGGRKLNQKDSKVFGVSSIDRFRRIWPRSICFSAILLLF